MKLHEFLLKYPFMDVRFSCECKNFGEPVFRMNLYNRTYSYGESVFMHLVRAYEIDNLLADFETAMLTAATNWLTTKQESKYPKE